MSKLDEPCYDEIALCKLLRAQIETYLDAFGISVESLAGKLGIPAAGAKVLLEQTRWPLEETLRVATALGIRVTYSFRGENS